jgi:hypothetical protein
MATLLDDFPTLLTERPCRIDRRPTNSESMLQIGRDCNMNLDAAPPIHSSAWNG